MHIPINFEMLLIFFMLFLYAFFNKNNLLKWIRHLFCLFKIAIRGALFPKRRS